MDMSGEGINFDNLWSGPGMPFGGSLIMMALDVILYGLLAYYLDSVIPSEHGVKRTPLFCFMPSYWCNKKKMLNRVTMKFFRTVLNFVKLFCRFLWKMADRLDH